MPDFDPTVPLGIKVPGTENNALAMAGSMADTGLKLQNLQAMKMTLAAKARAGEIMSAAPDLDSGIADLAKDPLTAAWVPEIINTLQSVRSSQVSVQGEQMTQANTGMQGLFQALLPAVNDPGMFDEIVNTRLATMSPSARMSMARALPSIKAGLIDGLPDDPAAAGALFQQRLAAMVVGAGLDPNSVRAVTGTLAPQVIETIGPQGERITEAVGGPITSGMPGVISKGPTTTEAAGFAAEGETFAGDMANATADAKAIPGMALKMNNIIEALGQFTSGGGADVRASLAKGLQALKNLGLDVTNEQIDAVANGSIDASQFFIASIRPFVTNALKEAAQGTGNVMRPEVDAFMSMADITTDPEALMRILNQSKTEMQIGYARAKMFLEFKKGIEEGDPVMTDYGRAGFAQYFADNLDMDSLPKATESGIDLAPIKLPEKPKAAAASGDKASKLAEIFGDL